MSLNCSVAAKAGTDCGRNRYLSLVSRGLLKRISLLAGGFPWAVPRFFGLFLFFLFRLLRRRSRGRLGFRLGNHGVPFRNYLAVGLRRGAERRVRKLRLEALHERRTVRTGQPGLRLGKRRVAVRSWVRAGGSEFRRALGKWIH